MARYVVTGAAVVLPTSDRSERYLYRGAPFDSSAFTRAGIRHAEAAGLIAPAPKAESTADEAAGTGK